MKYLNQFSILSRSVYAFHTRWIAEHDHSDYSLIASCKGFRIPESGKDLHVGSGTLGFGIRNTAQRIRNPPSNDWNPESKFH